jgi:hypothetical protein
VDDHEKVEDPQSSRDGGGECRPVNRKCGADNEAGNDRQPSVPPLERTPSGVRCRRLIQSRSCFERGPKHQEQQNREKREYGLHPRLKRLGSLEQFEEMAVPVANDLRIIGVYDDDDRVGVERLTTAVADWFLNAHTGIIGTSSLEA